MRLKTPETTDEESERKRSRKRPLTYVPKAIGTGDRCLRVPGSCLSEQETKEFTKAVASTQRKNNYTTHAASMLLLVTLVLSCARGTRSPRPSLLLVLLLAWVFSASDFAFGLLVVTAGLIVALPGSSKESIDDHHTGGNKSFRDSNPLGLFDNDGSGSCENGGEKAGAIESEESSRTIRKRTVLLRGRTPSERTTRSQQQPLQQPLQPPPPPPPPQPPQLPPQPQPQQLREFSQEEETEQHQQNEERAAAAAAAASPEQQELREAGGDACERSIKDLDDSLVHSPRSPIATPAKRPRRRIAASAAVAAGGGGAPAEMRGEMVNSQAVKEEVHWCTAQITARQPLTGDLFIF
jgi:hypothetical protein